MAVFKKPPKEVIYSCEEMRSLAQDKHKMRNISSSEYTICRTVPDMCTEYEGINEHLNKELAFCNLYPAVSVSNPAVHVHLAYSRDRGWFFPARQVLRRIYSNPQVGQRREHLMPEGNRILTADGGTEVTSCYWDDFYYAKSKPTAPLPGSVGTAQPFDPETAAKTRKPADGRGGARITVQREKVSPLAYSDAFASHDKSVVFTTLQGVVLARGGADQDLSAAVLMQPPARARRPSGAAARKPLAAPDADDPLNSVLRLTHQETTERLKQVETRRKSNFTDMSRGVYDRMRALHRELPEDHTQPLSYWMSDFARTKFTASKGLSDNTDTVVTCPEELQGAMSYDSFFLAPMTMKNAVTAIETNPHIAYSLKVLYLLQRREHIYARLQKKISRHRLERKRKRASSVPASPPAKKARTKE